MSRHTYGNLYQSSQEIGWDVDDLDPDEYERRLRSIAKSSRRKKKPSAKDSTEVEPASTSEPKPPVQKYNHPGCTGWISHSEEHPVLSSAC